MHVSQREVRQLCIAQFISIDYLPILILSYYMNCHVSYGDHSHKVHVNCHIFYAENSHEEVNSIFSKRYEIYHKFVP